MANGAKTEISTIRREMQILRSLLIGMLGRDKEGDYRPAFVRKVLRAAKGKPIKVFRGPGSLLAEIRKS